MALIKTVGLCVVSILIEGISYSKEGKAWFENLKRPKYTFPFKFWYIVGSIYYLLFGIIAYRQFESGKGIFSPSIIILMMIMVINGLSNFIAFKYRSIKWFYLIIYPFGILLLWLIFILWKEDLTSALLASIYFIWLIYDLYFGYNVWKMND